MSYLQWRNHRTRWSSIFDNWPAAEHVVKVGTSEQLGRHCTNYLFAERSFTDGSKWIVKAKNHGKRAVEIVAIDDANLPPQPCSIAQRILNVPQLEGMPIKLTIEDDPTPATFKAMSFHQGGASRFLAPNSVQAKTVPDSFFAYPAKYTPVRAEYEVIRSPGLDKDVADFSRTSRNCRIFSRQRCRLPIAKLHTNVLGVRPAHVQTYAIATKREALCPQRLSESMESSENLSIAGKQDGPLSDCSFAAKDLFDIKGRVTGGGNPDWSRPTRRRRKTLPPSNFCLMRATLKAATVSDEFALASTV